MEVTSKASEVKRERCILAGGQQSGHMEGTAVTSINIRGKTAPIPRFHRSWMIAHARTTWTDGSVTASERKRWCKHFDKWKAKFSQIR